MLTAKAMETRQAHVITALCVTYPEIRTNRWRPAFREAFGGEEDLGAIVDEAYMIPDAFAINGRDLIFFEVEVTHPIPDDKLMQYGALWADLDYWEIGFAVLVVNKHGHVNPVDLKHHYWKWLCTSQPKTSPRFMTSAAST